MIHALYINLAARKDRNARFLRQFRGCPEFSPQRFDAIVRPWGAIGCCLSHIECLKIAKESQWDHLVVCEDDFELLVPARQFVETVMFYLAQPDWDVVMLAGFLRAAAGPITRKMAKTTDCQTTTCYLVRRHYYDFLLGNFEESARGLEADSANYGTYALDQYWKHLQKKDRWYISAPILGKQRPGYSDIERKKVNYDRQFMESEFNRALQRAASLSE